MTTVGALVDRTYRTYLEPPDYQPASVRLVSDIDDTQSTFAISEFDIPEDEGLLRLGSIIECGHELMRVTGFAITDRTVTVLRGHLGTDRAAHIAPSIVKLSPPYPRVEVFNAVRDNITQLYPDLFTVVTYALTSVGESAYPIPDDLVVELIEANPNNSFVGNTVQLGGRIVDWHHLTDGRALILNAGALEMIWARFRRRFGVAESEDDVLADLGVEDVWQTVVMAGVAADMMAGRDVPTSHTDWVQATLESENIRVGTRTQISVGLVRYRELLIDRFKKEMVGEDSSDITVQMNDPFAIVR
jgi:hypothetical protein